jgi:hypothetical protein
MKNAQTGGRFTKIFENPVATITVALPARTRAEFCDGAMGCSTMGDPCAVGMICNEATDTCDTSVNVDVNGCLPGAAERSREPNCAVLYVMSRCSRRGQGL